MNGGGQIRGEGEASKDFLQRVEQLYNSVGNELPEKNERVKELYEQWLEGRNSVKVEDTLLTQYHAVEKITSGLSIKW